MPGHASKRPLLSKDIVRVVMPDVSKNVTGIVNRVDVNTGLVNVFITQDNPSGIGIWYDKKHLKRIGRTR
jgi:hypothetical protein